jgi:Carboxypeptidase regulatory-like domain
VGIRSRAQRRRLTLATAVAVSLVSAGLSAAPALAKTIKLNGSVIETQDNYTLNGNPECTDRDILLIAVPKQIISVSATIEHKGVSFGQAFDDTIPEDGSPPFTTPITGYGPNYPVPQGEAGWFLGGGGGPAPCGSGLSGWSHLKAHGVIPSNLVPISGTATDDTGKPVPGAQIDISGPSSATLTTDSIGAYIVLVKKGHYTVTAKPPPADKGYHVKATTCDVGSSSGSQCDGNTGTSGLGADFEITPLKHIITFHFSPADVPADGTGHFDGAINDSDELGNPVVGEALQITPPADVNPPAVVCSATGRLIYPQVLSTGEPLGTHPVLSTNGAGNVPLSIWPGTVAGDWDLTANEVAHPSVTNDQPFSFTPRAATAFPTNVQVGQDFANAVRATIAGTAGTNLFANFGAFSGQSTAANQAVLLAFLDSARGSFPGVDFGPVTDGSQAGVLFYPQGTLSAGEASTPGVGVVLDITQADAIIQAISNNQPVPVSDEALPAWSGWHPDSTAIPKLGPLAPYPDQQFTYFGLPYPPAADSLANVTSFCARPDPQLATYQTQSPITLSFAGANGKAPDGAQLKTGERTTYVVPKGAYRVTVTGTGSGLAHLVTMAAGAKTEQIHTFVFHVRRGQHGSLTVSSAGTPGTLRLGAKRVSASKGLLLVLRGLPASLPAKRRSTLRLSVTYVGQPVFGAAIQVRGDGVRASTSSNGAGRAAFSVRARKRGRVAVTVTEASSVLRTTLRIR